MEKELTLQRAKLAGEITTLATLITNSTEADIFVEYHGHIDKFEMTIYSKGWGSDRNNENTIDSSCYIGEEHDPYSLTDLYKAKRQLVQMLKDKELNFERLDYTTETITYRKHYLG